jgi:hypothetical protein
MALPPALTHHKDEVLFVKLAREIAIDHHDIETILKTHQITDQQWLDIRAHPRFRELLSQQLAEWQSATNTHERTALKAAALVEEWLPEANSRLHDRSESLNGKVELGKLLSRIAGMGLTTAGVEGGSGEKFSITINLGADSKLQFSKELPSKVIDVTPEGDSA